MIINMPEFTNWKEEAQFWDNVDTTQLMKTEGGEWIGPNQIKAASGSCPNCGAEMTKHLLDMKIAHGRILLHEVLFFICPRCGERVLPSEKQELVARTE